MAIKGIPSRKTSSSHRGPQAGLGAATLQQLVALFGQGRWAEAEALARQLTRQAPQDAVGWKALGVALSSQSRWSEALAPMQQAVQLAPQDAEAWCNLGHAQLQQGDAIASEASYRQAWTLQPQMPQIAFQLGNVLQTQGRHAEALAAYRQALNLAPTVVEVWLNQGNAQSALGDEGAAEASFRHALHLRPELGEAHYNLGNSLQRQGRAAEALVAYQAAASRAPAFAPAQLALGQALQAQGQWAAAELAYQRCLALVPGHAEAIAGLGDCLNAQGRAAEGLAALREAVARQPLSGPARLALGRALWALGRVAEAAVQCREAVRLAPELAVAHNVLGMAEHELGDDAAALTSYQRALALTPEAATIWNNLGNLYKDLPDFDQALAAYDQALALQPDFGPAQHNRLFTLNYHPGLTPERLVAEYRAWGEQLGQRLPEPPLPRPQPQPLRGRRLRVGYVSPDFRQHSMQYFLEPLLARHDHHHFDIWAYAELDAEDAVTARYRQYVDHWVPTRGLDDAALDARIRADGIDILVDLAGHTRGNRLAVLARQPSPVAVSWLGYGYTTGLSQIDYFLTDAWAVPPGQDALYAETPWRLDGPFLAYRPATGMGEPGPLPALSQGRLTLGTLTRSVRLNDRVLDLWAQILHALPQAHLLVNSLEFASEGARQRLRERLAQRGIAAERLDVGQSSPPWDVLRRMDVMLDCFPHNSGTTLIESLYMGVPFVTLAGSLSMQRLGLSILQAVGHAEWAADTEAGYLQRVLDLASDLPRLAITRQALRGQMLASPLMDEAGFARRVEAAYVQMWAARCGSSC